MNPRLFTNFNIILYWLIGIALCLSGLGCKSPQEHKLDADEQVYNSIERKWNADLGSKANYKISDTPASPNDVQVEKVVPPSGVLGLAQAVKIATAHNRLYQFEKEALYLQGLDLTLVQHRYVPNLFGTATGEYTKDGGDETIGSQGAFGFDQLLATGATISTRVAAGWIDVLTGDMRSGLSTILSATVVQPLLRGSGSEIALENLTQADRNLLYQLRLFNRFRKSFVVSIISQYYRVLEQQDLMKNAQDNYNTLYNEYDRMKKLAAAGRLPRFELDQAQQDQLQAKDIYIQEQKQYQQLIDEFKIELSLPTTVELQLDENVLEALRTIEMVDNLDFDETDAIDTALNGRLDLANSADMIDDAERKVLVATDSLRAELNLVGSVDATSRRRTDIGNSGHFDSQYDLGLELDLPFDRLAERNAYRKALITLSQRRREYDQDSDIVVLEVRQAYRDLAEAAQRYRVQMENVELAQKRYRNTTKLLRFGRANTRDVLDAQEDLFEGRNDATTALVDYTVSTLNFYRDTGLLQVRPDGMWQY